MLSIGKIGSSQAQQDYYEESVAKSREDYYQGTGEAPGQWWGDGAGLVGMTGIANKEQLRNLFAGRHPETGEQLRSTKGNVKVHGLDLTFSAPKGISVVYALGWEELQALLVEAHEYAVDQGMTYMQREATMVVRGHRANAKQKAQGIEDTLTTHRAQGLTAIKYRHRMNRLLDPQMHTHVVVGNFAFGPDGRWTSLDATPIYDHAKAAGHVYQAALRWKVRELVPWIRWGEVEKGMAELDPDLLHPELLKEFSQRTADINKFVEEYLGLAGAGHDSKRGLRQYATLQTRKPKLGDAVVEQEWREDVAARAAEFNVTQATLRAYEQGAPYISTERVDLNHLAERIFGPAGVTGLNNTFERKDVVIEWAAAHRDGLPSLNEIDQGVEHLMGDHQVVYVDTRDLRTTYTTQELRDTEQRVLDAALQGKAAGRAQLTPEEIEEGLADFHESINHEFVLSSEQQDVVRGVLGDGNAISSVEALAGSGKTTTAAAMRMAFEAAGYRTIGMGPTGRAVRELGTVGGFKSPHTLSWWEMKFATSGLSPRETLESVLGNPDKAVAFVDEAGMTDTRLFANVVIKFYDNGVKVVPIGDSQQLPSVRAGGILHGITRQVGSYRLTEVRRQVNKLEISALEKVRSGKSEPYVELKSQTVEQYLAGWEMDYEHATGEEPTEEQLALAREEFQAGRSSYFADRADLEVIAGPGSDEIAMRSAVTDYLNMREVMLERQENAARLGESAPGAESIALITKDNIRRQQLNQAIRHDLTGRGVLVEHATLGTRDGRPLDWAIGDRVIARKNDRGYDLDNGTRGTVTAITDTHLTIRDDHGGEREIDAAYVSDHLDHAYALTGHGTQGATLEWAGVIGLPSDFSREWAYTALTRSKEPTHIYLVGGYTLGEKERLDYATVPEPEADVIKLMDRMEERMKLRDADDLAVLKIEAAQRRAVQQESAQLEEAEHSEVTEAFDRQLREQTEIPLQRMRDTAPDQVGPKVHAYAQVRAALQQVRAEIDSDMMQDAVAAAQHFTSLQADLERVNPDGFNVTTLSPATQANIANWQGQQQQILAVYPDPHTVLQLDEQQRIREAYLVKTLPYAREAALYEHIGSDPEWLRAIPSKPAVESLRGVWEDVTRERGGSYIDEITAPQRVQEVAAAQAEATQEQQPVSRVEVAEQALAGAETAWRGSNDLNAFNQVIAARHEWAGAVIDSNPQWLQGTLGERPSGILAQERWQAIAEQLAGLRREREVTSEFDNGIVPQQDGGLLNAIRRFRVDVGLDAPEQEQSAGYER